MGVSIHCTVRLIIFIACYAGKTRTLRRARNLQQCTSSERRPARPLPPHRLPAAPAESTTPAPCSKQHISNQIQCRRFTFPKP